MEFTDATRAEVHNKQLGVYTKTLVDSPVVRWILYARIRESRYSDVLFIGDDFVHVRQLEAQRHLRHTETKKDFDARILAASIVRTGPHVSTDEPFFKQEPYEAHMWHSGTPSERLVLALSTNELLLLHLSLQDDGTYEFVQHRVDLPSSTCPVYSLGEHLCVDPESRAVAVAAMERHVWICSIETPDPEIPYPGNGIDVPLPITCRLNFQTNGIVQNMSFLTPQAGDEDHVILLLIVIESGLTKAVWIDWYHSLSLENAHQHPGQALDSDIHTSSLLIPMRDASFLLVKGQDITHWRGLLSGSATAYAVPTDFVESEYPGVSPRAPTWASWTRPCRNPTFRRQRDDVYVAREDGLVFLLREDYGVSVETCLAGKLNCHVGTAFAALGNEVDPDILAVVGDMSNGKIVTIGDFLKGECSSRKDAMSMSLTQWLPNWASTIDMMPSDLGTTATSTRFKHSHGFYVTAGRQPYGSVMELRRGLEFQSSAYFDLYGLKIVTDVWALPDLSSGSAFILISRPTTTQLLQVSSDITGVTEIMNTSFISTSQRTLAAGILLHRHFVQVTSQTVSITRTLDASSEDIMQTLSEEYGEILMAVVISQLNTVVCVCVVDSQYVLEHRYFTPSYETEESWIKSSNMTSLPLDFKPLCIATTCVSSAIVVAFATADNRIAIRRGNDGSVAWYFNMIPQVATEDISVCDHIAILHSSIESAPNGELLVVCGLRDGRIITYHVDLNHTQPFRGYDSIRFSNSTVKIVQLDAPATRLTAISEANICLLEWTGGTPSLSSVESIWVSDKSRPDLSQGPVAACAMMPSADELGVSALADSLIMVCHDEVLVGSLQRYPTTIPREIAVSGTPNRLTYSNELRCLVCSTEYSEVLPSAPSKPHGASSTKRRRWPIIEFIPTKHTTPSFTYQMQPGDRVHALLSWSHRSNEEKTYSYILVGGSYLTTKNERKGRVRLLQPRVRDRKVTAVLEDPHDIRFEFEVYSLGSYDGTTFVAAYGEYVCLYRFNVEAKKWDRLCPPFRLASPAICISTREKPDGHRSITVSTTRDSIVALELRHVVGESGSEAGLKLTPVSMGPHAEMCQTHLTLPSEDINQNDDHATLTLVSTKDARLIGLSRSQPSPTRATSEAETQWKQAETVFHASLTGSLKRIWKCEPFERKGRPPSGIMDCRIAGSRTDGAVIGIALLDWHTWRRLAWLQRLCEWSEEVSPCSAHDPPYTLDRAVGEMAEGRWLPIGLGDAYTSVKLQSRLETFEDYHINGDVVCRVLKRGGLEAVKKALRQVSETAGGSGTWVREHLEEELQAAEKAVELVRCLHTWL